MRKWHWCKKGAAAIGAVLDSGAAGPSKEAKPGKPTLIFEHKIPTTEEPIPSQGEECSK
tara:strand:+ start:273 stop:449 length:177 start_codon:yes stop_codon:yes gene_type:complete